VLLEENEQVMIENPRTEGWFVWGMHVTVLPDAPDALLTVVELPAVKEMISMLAQGYVTGLELTDALDAFAQQLNPSEPRDDDTAGDFIAYDCPLGCPVCAAARAEFDAIAAKSFLHKVRLSDPNRYPYAAGKSTLHRSGCPRVARYVGRPEPVGSAWSLAGLPAFAHHGVCSTTWAAGMEVMTAEEAADWVRWQTDPRHGTGYKLCCHCLSPIPGAVTDVENAPDVTYWPAENSVTWG
jgi:hypothetical protein